MSAPSAMPSTQQIVRHLEPWAAACDSYVGSLGWVSQLADRCGVPRRFISLILTSFVVCLLLLGLGQTLVATLVGVCYPAYQSMKALDGLRQQESGVAGAPAPFDSITQWCVRGGEGAAAARARESAHAPVPNPPPRPHLTTHASTAINPHANNCAGSRTGWSFPSS